MAELPRHPEPVDGTGPQPDSQPVRRSPSWALASGVVLAVVVVLVVVVLHLTGALGAGAHS